MTRLTRILATIPLLLAIFGGSPVAAKVVIRSSPIPAGCGARDVWPAADGTVWFTAQAAGKLGRLDPRTGKVDMIGLGPGAARHGVVVGPEGAARVTAAG